jgi:hypothetical protein
MEAVAGRIEAPSGAERLVVGRTAEERGTNAGAMYIVRHYLVWEISGNIFG